MIDLHCHMLPGIDDGAPDIDTALTMAHIAAADGITVTACTPHIYPGLYENTGSGIKQAVSEFEAHLAEAHIDMSLTYGADTHLAPDLLYQLRDGRVPSLHGSRYFLLEPPHHVAPQGLDRFVFDLITGGYVPVITHPERLTWVGDHYDLFRNLVSMGAWMQLTAGSLCGRFGDGAKHWAKRFLDDGLTHILATDAHSIKRRPPLLSEGYEVAKQRLGSEEADNLVLIRPQGIIDNTAPDSLPALPLRINNAKPRKSGFIKRLLTWH